MTTAQLRAPSYEQCAHLAETGDRDTALAAYTRYLETHPTDGEALNDLGTLLYASGRLDEAAVHLETAARRLGTDRPLALWNLAEVHLASGQPARTLALFDDLHRADMLTPDLANRTATALLDAGDAGGAVESLLACRAALPGQDLLTDFVDAIRSQRAKVAFFCDSGDEKFLADIVPWTDQRFPTRFAHNPTREEMEHLLQWCDIAWLEWCTPQVVLASRLPKTCRTIVRLHRYEAFKPWPAQVNWDNIDVLVTIGNPYVNAHLRQTVPGLQERTRVITIPSAVNLRSWPLAERTRGKDLACFGYINMRKNPGLLLQCFAELHRRDPEYRLHLAGRPQDPMLMQYLTSMIRELGLEDAVTLEGWVEDPRAWLRDKHYLVSASLGEGLPAGILEAMATGLKPVIHTWPGARHFFPPQWLWRNADEFCRCILDGEYQPRLYHEWVAERYSLRSQLGQISGVFAAMEREPWPPAGNEGETADPPAKGVPDAANAPDTRDADRFYDQWYQGALVAEGRYQQARREQVVQAVATLQRRDLAIIDLGCGLGHLEPHLAPFGNVVGVDLSREAVRAARRHCPAATFVCGDVRTMRLPSGSFDVVTSVEVLEHFAGGDQAGHLARARDLLAGGGLLVLTTPNRPVMEALSAECIERDGRPWTDQPIENWLDSGALRALAEEAGFAVQRLEPFIREGDHDGLHLVLVARKDGAPAEAAQAAAGGKPAVAVAPGKATVRAPRLHPAPVFVFGNQKSGTTAIAALLARAAGKTFSYDIFARLTAESHERLLSGQRPFRDLVAACPHEFEADVIKAPTFGLFYDDLGRLFPEGRFVFIVRDPRENIRSILDRLGLPGDLDALRPRERQAWADLPGWRFVMEGRLPPVAGANYVETLANRWNLFADLYLHDADRIECLRYEDFCADKTGTVAGLAARMGWEVVHDISAEVDRPYQRPGRNRGTPWREFFGPENLARIERLCGRRMQAFGYPPDAGGEDA